MNKNRLINLLVSGLALGSALTAGVAVAAPAHASSNASLYLYDNSPIAGQWEVQGKNFAPGLSNVQLWIEDLTTKTILEYQTGIATTPEPGYVCYPYVGCYGWLVGFFGAQGALNSSDQIAEHPLQCGHVYQAQAYDATDSQIYSNDLTMPACRYLPEK
jgi:hypothetical protein